MPQIFKESGRKITKVSEIILSATATAATIDAGIMFYLCNAGTNTAYIGPSASECLWELAPGAKEGPFVVPFGDALYMRGTAGDKVLVMYLS